MSMNVKRLMRRMGDGKFGGLEGLAALLLVVAAGLWVQFRYMNEFPAFVHAWAQDDRYALAIGFLSNGFDLFHPETMLYNKQFPGWWEVASPSTVTAVDFPLHEYVVAVWMKLLGTTSPWVFRCWTLLCSVAGLFFLYKLARMLTGSFLKSLLLVGMAMTAPVYAYYFNGFLPGIPAFAFGVTGLWAYLRFVRSGGRRFLDAGVACITLAMLMRTTFAIEWVAVLCFELLRMWRKESLLRRELPAWLLSLACFAACFLWNRHLRLENGSLFLNALMPPKSVAEAESLLSDAWSNWGKQYFQPLQYLVFVLLALCAAVKGVLHRRQARAAGLDGGEGKWPLPLGLFVGIYLFGCLLFALAMMQQLPHHDYYFIDTFFLPLLLWCALLLGDLPVARKRTLRLVGALAVCALFLLMLRQVRVTQQERRWPGDQAYQTYLHFQGADVFLDSLHVPAEAKILSLYAYPQNGPFIQMRRKGYSVMWDKESLVRAAFQWDFAYIVVENAVVREHFEERKEVLGRLHRIADNGRIALCSLSDSLCCASPEAFFAEGELFPDKTFAEDTVSAL